MATEALNHVTGVFDTLKPVFNAVPVVKNAIGLIAEIVELARQARQNKKDCAALSDRVSALQKVLEDCPDKESMREGAKITLESLVSALETAKKIVKIQTSKNLIKRLIVARSSSREFENINNIISRCVADLQLGITLFDAPLCSTEQHAEDFEDMFSGIQQLLSDVSELRQRVIESGTIDPSMNERLNELLSEHDAGMQSNLEQIVGARDTLEDIEDALRIMDDQQEKRHQELLGVIREQTLQYARQVEEFEKEQMELSQELQNTLCSLVEVKMIDLASAKKLKELQKCISRAMDSVTFFSGKLDRVSPGSGLYQNELDKAKEYVKQLEDKKSRFLAKRYGRRIQRPISEIRDEIMDKKRRVAELESKLRRLARPVEIALPKWFLGLKNLPSVIDDLKAEFRVFASGDDVCKKLEDIKKLSLAKQH